MLGDTVTSGQLLALLGARAEAGTPLRVGLIGAGKFGTMFLSQARCLPDLHVLGVADLSVDRARQALTRAGWPPEQHAAAGFADALRTGTTYLTDRSDALIAADRVDVIVEATGIPTAGIHHALQAIAHGRHVVMVNVEADALADRKSTRLNSSHVSISYAVFCLKKKKTTTYA